ncbi:MAG TPA: glutamate synthase large subunit [Candidatus Acidoferrum sp.]|nr:glutamate synthase large subunit [Candidatus Acidoferrum sp.]
MREFVPEFSADHDACGVGFVAQLGASPSRGVIDRSLTALARLAHRGGVDADGLSGDGAGLLLPISQGFFRSVAQAIRLDVPQNFGLGMAFIDPARESEACAAVERCSNETGICCLGWRSVPTEPSILGPRAASTLPLIRQCFFSAAGSESDLERALFFLRKRIEAEASGSIYFSSLSSRTIVYKGLLAPLQLREFYPDLDHPDFKAAFAVFHQRYSTNTRPTWTLAQPFRFVAHNGEINTIGANRRWIRARTEKLRAEFGADEWFHPLEEGVSDSASFDNALEILLRRGYNAAAAMLRLVPPATKWNERPDRADRVVRNFLQREAREQEPWDGPAALVFSDGRFVGAKLDRNGLRPLRYTLTENGLLVLGSEAGLADFAGEPIAERRRLGPGELLLVDSATGQIYRDKGIARLLESTVESGRSANPSRIKPAKALGASKIKDAKRIASALGWTEDQFKLLFQPLGLEGKEAIWSMGDDAPPAFVSAARRPLWDYCKQRFAQVTNPAIDPLREAHVMSLDVYIGANVTLDSPLIDARQLRQLASRLGQSCTIDFTFDVSGGTDAAVAAIDRVRAEARAAASSKSGFVLLTDRAVYSERAALPALLACAAVWNELVKRGASDVPLIVESGQVIETHHVALLIAAGATAALPYLALQFSEILKPGGAKKYRAAVEAGLRKVLARMGISTIASYRNSHLFEVVGLDEKLHSEFFENASAALGGKALREILQDALTRHAEAFDPSARELNDAGLYRFRQTGERHSNSPELVRRMHRYIKSPTPEAYASFKQLADAREPVAIRDLIEIVPGKASAIALGAVQPESEILSRFSTQAMSLGALGPEAHRTLAIAMNRLGAKSNTGEGGEDPDVYRLEPDANNRIKQVASARFGVTAEYLVRADELEIKMAQGSKPGEGGQLPAAKVNAYIARLRHAVPGMSLISPPPHHDIYSIEDLAQLIYDLRAINPGARIGVKLVSGAGVGIIAAGVAKAGADVITISGFDGGTGASPLTSIKNTGLPWEVGLREAHRALIQTGFRARVRLRVDGGFKFGRDVILGALLGANEFGFGTSALLAIGCVMARQCHLNTCPAGIATQDETMRTRFNGTPEMVIAYFRGVAAEVRERLATLGARSLDEIVGATQFLAPRTDSAASAVSTLLAPAPEPPARISESGRDAVGVHGELIRRFSGLLSGKSQPDSSPSAPSRAPRRIIFPIANSDRTVGAHLSGEVLRSTSFEGLGDGMIDCEFRGVAGQSFAAFLISGLCFRLRGEANDYVGKSLSGGTIAISAGAAASRRGDVLAGNTVLYGATSGELYIAGRAGERFAVRNSGALAVVEGLGDHGCEYMTAGVVLILGDSGVNLCSGMTGGLVYAPDRSVAKRNYNPEFVRCPAFEEQNPPSFATSTEDASGMPAWSEVDDDQEDLWLRRVLREHVRLTGSPRARRLLNSTARLPLVRLEPVHLPCSIAKTWEPILNRLEQQEMIALAAAEKGSSLRVRVPAVPSDASAITLHAARATAGAESANPRIVSDAGTDSVIKPR